MPICNPTPSLASSRQGRKHYVSLGIAVLTCPCHLPLLLAAFAGTAVGGWLSQYTLVVALAMVGLFGLAPVYAFGAFNRHRGVSEASARREMKQDDFQQWALPPRSPVARSSGGEKEI